MFGEFSYVSVCSVEATLVTNEIKIIHDIKALCSVYFYQANVVFVVFFYVSICSVQATLATNEFNFSFFL